MGKEKNGYEVLPWHGRGWHCYSYLDSWGNYHSEVEIPWNDVVADIEFNGGYGYDSWAVTQYLIRTGEVISSSYFGAESGCTVYRDETAVIKSVVMNLWASKAHPKVNIYDLKLFRKLFPLTYKVVR